MNMLKYAHNGQKTTNKARNLVSHQKKALRTRPGTLYKNQEI
jgi:hypothetical protein